VFNVSLILCWVWAKAAKSDRLGVTLDGRYLESIAPIAGGKQTENFVAVRGLKPAVHEPGDVSAVINKMRPHSRQSPRPVAAHFQYDPLLNHGAGCGQCRY
jgi:hypothetical protein